MDCSLNYYTTTFLFVYVVKIKIQTIAFIECSIIFQPNGVRFL